MAGEIFTPQPLGMFIMSGATTAFTIMTKPDCGDLSRGYDAHAFEYAAARRAANVGVNTILTWARSIGSGRSVLDLGCGDGVPVLHALTEAGLTVYGIPASAAMIRSLERSFPNAHAACEDVERSSFFGRRFDAVMAMALIFLLSEPAQVRLIRRAAQVRAAREPAFHGAGKSMRME